MRLAMSQSNYIPWRGYFDLIASVDAFVIYDDVQYTKADWRNRNRVKTRDGVKWLSVPVYANYTCPALIRDTEIASLNWSRKHWRTIHQAYSKAPHFSFAAPMLEELLARPFRTISELNIALIRSIAHLLGITTPISLASDHDPVSGKLTRAADMCTQLRATVYVSGPRGRDYLDPTVFADRGIRLEWFDYSGYPEYPQLWGAFVHDVSVIDLLFNCGAEAGRYMKYVHPAGRTGDGLAASAPVRRSA